MFRAELARRESDPGHHVIMVAVSYKDTALTTELRAGKSQSNLISGAEGSRTLTIPLKRRKRCRYATTPKLELGVCV